MLEFASLAFHLASLLNPISSVFLFFHSSIPDKDPRNAHLMPHLPTLFQEITYGFLKNRQTAFWGANTFRDISLCARAVVARWQQRTKLQ